MNVDKLGAIQMTTRTTPASPQVYARIGGILYLIIIIAGALGEIFIRGQTCCIRRCPVHSQPYYGFSVALAHWHCRRPIDARM